MKNLEWDDMWQGLFYAVVVIFVAMLTLVIASDKTPTGYYLDKQTDSTAGERTCIRILTPWEPDGTAACFREPLDAARLMVALKDAENIVKPSEWVAQ